jgi:AbrB family looped-hinge helix DNA binding protein
MVFRWYITIVNATTTIDKAGRIVLPKQIRQELQLGPGDVIELEASEDRVVLRPARGKGRMYKEHGMWVFDSGEPLTVEMVNKTLRQVREERDQRNVGKLR